MELPLFEVVADALRSFLPTELSDFHHRAHRYGLKVWFGSEAPSREHYEAQVIGAKHVADASVLALEIGFHAEHRNPADNEAVLTKLLASEKQWRRHLGGEAVAGPFIGRPDDWRRISETWADPDLSDPQVGLEIAGRLADYVGALEPGRTG